MGKPTEFTSLSLAFGRRDTGDSADRLALDCKILTWSPNLVGESKRVFPQ
jgi:hypothetical protein